MTIGIDFDSTLAKIDQIWLDRLNFQIGTNYRAKKWSDWELSFLQESERSLFFRLFTPDIYKEVRPYPHSVDAIHRLEGIPGVELKVITATPNRDFSAFADAKQKWLERHFPSLAERIIFTNYKNIPGLSVLVDDSTQHLDTTTAVPVLVDRPWNRGRKFRYHFADWRKGGRILVSLALRGRKFAAA